MTQLNTLISVLVFAESILWVGYLFMNNQVKVDYDSKTRRLKITCPFFLADAMRNFPARRFDPKSKTWRMPLTRANVEHLENSKHVIDYVLSTTAIEAIADYQRLTSGPRYIPFPYHQYDFSRSATGFNPMDHQRRMLDKVWNLPAAAWFAKMGTGKTFAAVHLACARFKAGLIDSVVIICPSTLRSTWRKELAKYATTECDFRIHDTKASWYKAFCSDRARPGVLQILAVSVEGLGVSTGLYDSVCGFFIGRNVMVINDESSRIKNPSAVRTKRAIELSTHAKYKIILNGTPIAIGMEDLWSQYEFLDPNIIGSGDYWSFKTRYVTMGGYENKQIVGYQNVEELMSLIEPYTVEVGKDVLDLPPKVMKIRYVTATAEQRKLLRLIKKGTHDENDPLIKVDNVLERVLRWRQVVGGWLPRQDPITEQVTLEPLKDNPKMDSFLDMIADHYQGSKFIIWSPFVHEIEYIHQKLTDIYGVGSAMMYYGKTDKAERSAIEDAYCNDPNMRFFIANPQTAGLGLTLISGMDDIMIYYSGTNAYIDRAQSEDRAHRIGQFRTVAVVDMVMEKTIDEVIIASIAEKMSVEEYIMARLKAGKTLDNIELEG
jgi:SNF2 family DNA or RNA helicase